MIRVARGEEPCRELRVAIPGSSPKRKRIFPRQVGSNGRSRNRVEIGFAGTGRAECFLENIQDSLLARIQRLITLALLETDHDVVLRSNASRIANALNRAVGQARLLQALADLIDRRGTGKPHIHKRTPAEINSVERAVLHKNGPKDGNPANGQEKQGKNHEVLRFPHPVNVYAVEEFHAGSYPS